MTYPLRIRFWYRVHDAAERLWHWVYRAKIKPYFDARGEAEIPPDYRLIQTIPATEEEKARGITEKRVYSSSPSTPVTITDGGRTYDYRAGVRWGDIGGTK